MEINNIIEKLDANKIAYDGKFKKIGSTFSFSSDNCYNAYKDAMEMLETVVSNGMVFGFGWSHKELIKKLTKICVNLTAKNAERTIKNVTDTLTEIRLDVNKLESKESHKEANSMIKSEVFKFIDTSIAGATYLKENDYKNDQVGKTYLEKSLDLLQQIRSAVENVHDGSSPLAAEKSKNLVMALIEWRTHTANNSVAQANIDTLQKVLSIAQDWGKIAVSAKGKIAKSGEYPVYWPDGKEDTMGRIAKMNDCVSKIERLEVGIARVAGTVKEYNLNAARIVNEMQEVQAEINRINNRRAEIDAEEQNIVRLVDNGEMSEEVAEDKLEFLAQEREDIIEYNLSNNQDRLEMLRQQREECMLLSRNLEQLINKFERVIEQINLHKDDYVNYVNIVTYMDTEKMWRVLNGNAIGSDYNDVVDSIEFMQETIEHVWEGRQKGVNLIKQKEDEHRTTMKTMREKARSGMKTGVEEKKPSRLAELRAKRDQKQPEVKNDEPVLNTEDEYGIIPTNQGLNLEDK